MDQEEIKLQKMVKILAIDDEETVAKLYQSLITEMGYTVVIAKTGKDAVARIDKESFDLVLLDLKLPDVHGCELLGQIKEKIGNAPVIIVTAHPTLESSIDAIRTGGVYDYIIKPFKADALKVVIRRAVEKALLTSENKRLLKRLEISNQVLGERVEQLEKVASVALSYEGKISELKEQIRQLEKR